MFLALLPVRDGAAELDDWFDSVRDVVDGVIALDDGSTDGTLERLRAEPLVIEVLTNPPRPTAEGWDDRANRQRLLDAARSAGAEWVLWLDADERLNAADGAPLREFVAADADPDFAYGFALYDQVDDDRFVSEPKWVYRLHACQPDDTYPERRLHFPPVPTRIPRRRWLRTSLRIEHLGMATPQRRQQRFDKYGLVDPDRRWQATYDHLLEEPTETAPLPPRSMESVVLGVHDTTTTVDVSVVVIAHHDLDRIDDVIDSALSQTIDGVAEVIVVASGSDGTAAHVSNRGDVRVVDLGPSATPGAARNAARHIVQGDFIVFLGSHVRMVPGSLDARLRAHRRGWAMVTGPLLDGSTSRVGRAAFVIDHAASAPGRRAAELARPPTRCSYVRFALDRAGWFPDVRAGEDTAVNVTLFERGFSAFVEPAAAEIYASSVDSVAELLAKHRERGRALARLRRERGDEPPRVGLGYVIRRIRRLVRAVWRHPDRRRLMGALPLASRAVLAARSGYVRGA